MQFGILGQQAPELTVKDWIGPNGDAISPFQIGDYEDKVRVIYCFQAWCPGCHTRGFPTLKKLKNLYEEKEVVFAVLQTTFEGHTQNGPEQRRKMQLEYGLDVPFGQDETYPRPDTMVSYRTGGTPWFIIVDRDGTVVFNDYHVDLDHAKELIDRSLAGGAAPAVEKAIVEHQPQNSQFIVQFPGGAHGRVDYAKKGNTLHLLHTEVTGNERGKGLGSWMMELVLEEIEKLGLKVKPVCSFAMRHLSKYQRWAPIKA